MPDGREEHRDLELATEHYPRSQVAESRASASASTTVPACDSPARPKPVALPLSRATQSGRTEVPRNGPPWPQRSKKGHCQQKSPTPLVSPPVDLGGVS